jgi:hypothetical protein
MLPNGAGARRLLPTQSISGHGVRDRLHLVVRPDVLEARRDVLMRRGGKRSGINGGRTRTRTWDPLIKSQLLYQLSYAPGMPPRSPARAASCSKASSHCPGKGRNGSIRDGFRSSPRGAPPRRSRRGDPVAGTQCWALDSRCAGMNGSIVRAGDEPRAE